MIGGHTLISTALALVVALVFGPLLGRLATQWFSGRGLSNLLTELRGAFLPFLLAPLVYQITHWPTWAVIGTVVGFVQAVSVGRWVARRSGEWSPSLMGGIALGRSRAALLSARSAARGAVVATLATTVTHIILLEAILTSLNFPGLYPVGSVGERLHSGAGVSGLFLLLIGGSAIFLAELAASWLLQRRATSSRQKESGAA